MDQEALKYINSQKKLNHRHGKWASFLQIYSCVLKHKAGTENKAADALKFVLYSAHEALKHINSQKKLNHRHDKWASFLQLYSCVIKHNAGTENKAADALSRVVHILTSMAIHVIGFDVLKRDYPTCKDFSVIYGNLQAGQRADYVVFPYTMDTSS